MLKRSLLVLAGLFAGTLGATHWTEPDYDYYITANWRNMQYSPDINLRFYQPKAEVQMKLSDENDDNDQINFQVSCLAYPANMQVEITDIAFTLANSVRSESRSIERRITIRYDHGDTERVSLENWSRGRNSFILTTNYRRWLNDFNYIIDDDLVEDVLSNLMKDGRLTIEVQDDGETVKGIFIARPYPHISSPLLQATSECYYGSMHPDVDAAAASEPAASSQTTSLIDSSILEQNPFTGVKVFDAPEEE